jgi:TetR/AcrR family transcriptional regulator, transcriptional repressor for nem operon
MRYAAGHKQATRNRILEAAARAIRSEGPQKVSVSSVMRAASLTNGAFYAHFDSREAMVSAAVDRMFGQAQERFRRSVEGRLPLLGLADYFDFYLSAAHRDERASGCPVAGLGSDAPRMPTAVQAHFAQGVSGLTGQIAAVLRAAGCGRPEAEAVLILAQMSGAVSLARGANEDLSTQLLDEARTLLQNRLEQLGAPKAESELSAMSAIQHSFPQDPHDISIP